MNLILRGGRVIDPANGIDATLDVGIRDGKIAALAPKIDDPNAAVRDVSSCIVTPGLVDFHTHVYWGGASIGVEAENVAEASGTTTFIDAGTAGASNFRGFRSHVIERSEYRILAYLNISYPGIYAYGPNVLVGECADLRLLDMVECARVAHENSDIIIGIKSRLGKVAGGASGLAPLDMAIEVAEDARLPVMAHIDEPPPRREDVLMRLRKGDVLTHCYKPFPNALVRFDGQIREEVTIARERGIFFDIGHGRASFGFKVSREMLAAGFEPDIISSDVHAFCVHGPAYNLLVTMSKFLALGMPLENIIACVTEAPARALARRDFGNLSVGSRADVTVLDIEQGAFEYRDVVGEVLTASSRFALREYYLAGAQVLPGTHDH